MKKLNEIVKDEAPGTSAGAPRMWLEGAGMTKGRQNRDRRLHLNSTAVAPIACEA